MIITVTINPTMDILYQVEELKIGKTNRASNVKKMVGGKGINTSRVLTILGQDNLAVGFLAGNTGKSILEEVNLEGIKNKFLNINGESRNAVTIMHDNNTQTEINESGPPITAGTLSLLEKEILKALQGKRGAYVSLAGRIYNEHTYFYSRLISTINRIYPDVKVVVDTSGDALHKVLEGADKPYFIKPNIDELSELVGYEVSSNRKSLAKALDNPLFLGVHGVLVSLGAEGAFAKINGRYYDMEVPDVPIQNPTGSGDSTVAGLLYGLRNHLGNAETLRLAMACGISNAMQEKTGFVDLEEVETLKKQIHIKEIFIS